MMTLWTRKVGMIMDLFDVGMGIGIVALGVVGVFISTIIGIILYVFSSLGLMKLAQNRGIENAWLAWIPIGNLYIMGTLVGEMELFGLKIPKLELILPLAPIALGVIIWMPFVNILACLALIILNVAVLYHLFKMYRPDQAMLYTVLSLVLGLFWLFIFLIRNDQVQA